MKVLMIGHGCSPFLGSEPGITWNWAWHLSKYHEVWLLTHRQFEDHVHQFLNITPCPSLHIQWVDLPKSVDPFNPPSQKGLKLHYILWLRQALRVAKKLCHRVRFDVVHHVGWGTINVPSPFWKLKIPFIWGPVGGGQISPPQFLSLFPNRAFELARNFNTLSLPWRKSFRLTVKNSKVILTVNNDTAKLIKSVYKRSNTIQFLDCGITNSVLNSAPKEYKSRSKLIVLWAGVLESRKGLPIALRAIAAAKLTQTEFLIAGDGPHLKNYKNLAQSLGISKTVNFLGKIDWRQMSQIMREADVFLFTSIRDTFGSVLLEAAAHHLPIVTLDHQGAQDWIPNDAGIKVPVSSLSDTIAGMASALKHLEDDQSSLVKMSFKANEFAAAHTWEQRAAQMNELYYQAVSNNA